MPPRTAKQDPGYEDDDYDPDTDTPNTDEADQMLENSLNTESGIGHSKVLQSAERDFAQKNAAIEKANQKARADAAKSMQRDEDY
jgi:hypothetical protein